MSSKHEQGSRENVVRFRLLMAPPPVTQTSEKPNATASQYDQGWRQVRADLKRNSFWNEFARLSRPVRRFFFPVRSREEFRKDLGVGACLIALSLVILMTLLALFGTGCASLPEAQTGPAPKQLEAADQATLRGLVQVAQMGRDCTKQDRLLKRIISDMFVSADVPAPDQIEVRPLSGSSLCGISQGEADELGTPIPGARNIARAEVKLYWSLLYESQLRRAQRALALMAPLQPRK